MPVSSNYIGIAYSSTYLDDDTLARHQTFLVLVHWPEAEKIFSVFFRQYIELRKAPLFQGGKLGPRAQLSGAQFATFLGRTVGPWTTGPRGPAVRGPICNFLRADSWAPGTNCPGPSCPGSNCLGPNCLGPDFPRTGYSSPGPPAQMTKWMYYPEVPDCKKLMTGWKCPWSMSRIFLQTWPCLRPM